jgi:hypothetical protein
MDDREFSDRHGFGDRRLAVFHRVGRDAVHLIDYNKVGAEVSLESALSRTNADILLVWQCSCLDLAHCVRALISAKHRRRYERSRGFPLAE